MEGKDGINNTIKDYSSNLFTYCNPNISIRDLNIIKPILDNMDNESLTILVTIDETKDSLFSINWNKAPWPSGYNPLFHQTFWDTIKLDLFNTIKTS